jgi:hypothetical protein
MTGSHGSAASTYKEDYSYVPEQCSVKVYRDRRQLVFRALPDALPSTEEPSIFVREVDAPDMNCLEE